MLLISFIFFCLLLGSLVGFLAGLLGIGGGLVIVPALAYLFPLIDLSPDIVLPMALATSLASIVITSSSAAYAHHKNKNIPWPIANKLMLSVGIGAVIGAFIADQLSAEALTYIFAGAVILLASYMLLSVKITPRDKLPRHYILQLIALFTGTLASLMGIAGGAILVPILTFCGMKLRHTIGIATVCGVMIAFFGSIGYVYTGLDNELLPAWSLGYIYLPALVTIALTSSLVAPLGVKLAAKMPVRRLKRFFAIFLILVAIKMLW